MSDHIQDLEVSVTKFEIKPKHFPEDLRNLIESSTYDELCAFVRSLRLPKELQKTILALDHESLKDSVTGLIGAATAIRHTTYLQQEEEEV